MKKKKSFEKKKYIIKHTSILCGLLALLIVVNVVLTQVTIVSSAIGYITAPWDADKTTATTETVQYFQKETASKDEALAVAKLVAEQVQAEGSVLLKNENNTLPLPESVKKVSVFGNTCDNLVFGGTGSGSGDASKNVFLDDALAAAGYEVNPTLWAFYEEQSATYHRGGGYNTDGVEQEGGYTVGEVPQSAYTDAVKQSYSEYSDAAIIIIGRVGSEGGDLPTTSDYDYNHYLQLTQNEIDMIQAVEESGEFDRIVLLVNSSNAMELGFIEDESYGIDACLWIGGVGNYGINSVVAILKGEVNPSGRLVDTYAYSAFSAPAMMNYGDNEFVEGDSLDGNSYYVTYNEGIYVGYRYYETRYEDCVLNRFNADSTAGVQLSAEGWNYQEEVQFPFGFGLSYTQFTWSDYIQTEPDANGDIKVSVTVTNSGDMAGKEVVQLYFQSPYTEYDMENHVEKASVELVGFDKTGLLQPGESETVEITVNLSDLTAYDTYGAGTYILDAGRYYITAASNAHAALNNILQEKSKDETNGVDTSKMYGQGDAAFVGAFDVDSLDVETYSVSDTGYKIVNQFETEEFSSSMAHYDETFQYLSRSDWEATYPTTYGDKNATAGAARATFADAIKTEIGYTITNPTLKNSNTVDYVWDGTQLQTIEIGTAVTGADNGLNLIDSVIDEDGDGVVDSYIDDTDEFWTSLVQQMSIDELYKLCASGGYKTEKVNSIGKKHSNVLDGTSGIAALNGNTKGTAFPSCVVQASTWNVELAEEVGKAVGEEALWLNVQGWYAPAVNMHRTPFAGRNFEYYSEDGYISGQYAAMVCKGAQEKGLYVNVKHFALNDQETNRCERLNIAAGICTYSNEQAIREIYLVPFQTCVEEGGAMGIMSSFNRVGAIWSGAHYGLMTEVLRNEWGYEGLVITDFAGYSYLNMDAGIRAGNNLWLTMGEFAIEDKASDAAVYYLQKSAKRILYTESQASGINKLRPVEGDAQVEDEMLTWHKILIAFDCVALVSLAVGTFCTVRKYKKYCKITVI